MFKKIIYFFILYTIISQISAAVELPQYGKVYVYGHNYVYLSLDGFKSGDKVYLKVSFNNGHTLVNNRLSIFYVETDSTSTTSGLTTYTSESYSISNYDHTFYYTITLKNNYQYLVIRSPKITYSNSDEEVTTLYTIEHTKSNVLVIVIVFIVIIILAIVAFFIFRYVRRKAQDALIQPTYSNQPAYTNQPAYSNQPAYVPPSGYPQTQPQPQPQPQYYQSGY